MGCSFILGFRCLLLIFLVQRLVLSPAAAEVIYVSNTNDSDNYRGPRDLSLRNAIQWANQFGRKNTIILGHKPNANRFQPDQPQPRVFHLTIPGADEDKNKTGDLDITGGDLTIIGATTNVVIDATGLGDRVFRVSKNAKLTLQNVTITGGNAAGNASVIGLWMGESGGAIYNAGTLTLQHCLITNNASGGGIYLEGNVGGTGGGDGGGIYNLGKLVMVDCVVVQNSTGNGVDGAFGGNGGGVRNDGTCSLTDCVISGNQCGNGGGAEGNGFGVGGGGGIGGGIYNSGSITLSNCIIYSNASGRGGNAGSPTGTFFGNPPGGWAGAGGGGGGICNVGQMRLNFCTVNGNLCGDGGNGDGSSRGGNAGAGGSGGRHFESGQCKT